MPFKPPIVTEMDLIRGRQIVRSLMPLKRLSCDDAQIVARAIAYSFAEGRKQGMDIAKDNLQAYPWCPEEAAKGMRYSELKEVLRFLSGDHGQPNRGSLVRLQFPAWVICVDLTRTRAARHTAVNGHSQDRRACPQRYQYNDLPNATAHCAKRLLRNLPRSRHRWTPLNEPRVIQKVCRPIGAA